MEFVNNAIYYNRIVFNAQILNVKSVNLVISRI